MAVSRPCTPVGHPGRPAPVHVDSQADAGRPEEGSPVKPRGAIDPPTGSILHPLAPGAFAPGDGGACGEEGILATVRPGSPRRSASRRAIAVASVCQGPAGSAPLRSADGTTEPPTPPTPRRSASPSSIGAGAPPPRRGPTSSADEAFAPSDPGRAEGPPAILGVERIGRRILSLRGRRVILDADLATLYGVSTRRLNEQVRRNRGRFPADFAFLLTKAEFANLMSQSAISSSGWGGRRKPPLAFTEHGALMAAAVLNTPVAVAASILVMRAFVRLRELLAVHEHFHRRLAELETRHAAHDSQLEAVFEAIRALATRSTRTRRRQRIGFRPPQRREGAG